METTEITRVDQNASETAALEVGKPYCGWKEGEFDIHFIHTGGARYKVYYLSAQDESMTVDAVYGPFESGLRSKNA